MEIIKTNIEGVVLIKPRVFGDSRGYFFESFSAGRFEEEVCRTVFVQDNESSSRYGVLRGLGRLLSDNTWRWNCRGKTNCNYFCRKALRTVSPC